MQLEDIEEDQEKFWAEPVTRKTEASRGRSESLEASVQRPEQIRGSNLLAAAGIDFERRRKQLHSHTIGSIRKASGESRIFKDFDLLTSLNDPSTLILVHKMRLHVVK